MVIIADAGSTKTSWSMLQEGTASYFETTGINPYFYSRDEIAHKLLIEFPNQFPYEAVQEVRFFGAGVLAEDRKKIVYDALKGRFYKADIHVEDDLLGASIALCNDKPGIVCILGTGSNSCYFDGKQITSRMASGGYILGDEGSGAYIGKKLLIDFLRKKMPEALSSALAELHHLSEQEILRKVYTEKDTNRFLASMVPFLVSHADDSYCRELVQSAFEDFFRAHISRYRSFGEIPVHFTGSVAFHFKPLLESVLAKNGCTLGLVVRQPIEELVRYYQLKDSTE